MAKKYFVKRYGTREFTAQELVELSHDLKDYDAVKSDTDLNWRTYGEFDFKELAAEELGYKILEDGTIIKNGGSSGGTSNPPRTPPKNSSNSNKWIIGSIVVILLVMVVYNSINHSNSASSDTTSASADLASASASISTPTPKPKTISKPKKPLPVGIYAFIGRCNVRTEPNETSEITYEASNGEPCFYDGVRDGNWYYIEIAFGGADIEGWTHRDNLRHLDKLPDP